MFQVLCFPKERRKYIYILSYHRTRKNSPKECFVGLHNLYFVLLNEGLRTRNKGSSSIFSFVAPGPLEINNSLDSILDGQCLTTFSLSASVTKPTQIKTSTHAIYFSAMKHRSLAPRASQNIRIEGDKNTAREFRYSFSENYIDLWNIY